MRDHPVIESMERTGYPESRQFNRCYADPDMAYEGARDEEMIARTKEAIENGELDIDELLRFWNSN